MLVVGRMPLGIQEEYAVIAQGMRNGTLKEPPPEKPPKLWIENRFAAVKGDGYNSFCEHYNSRELSSNAFSFGLCTLQDSMKVSVPNDMTNGMTNDSPGPQVSFVGRESWSLGLPASRARKPTRHHLAARRRIPSRAASGPRAHSSSSPMRSVGGTRTLALTSATPRSCGRIRLAVNRCAWALARPETEARERSRARATPVCVRRSTPFAHQVDKELEFVRQHSLFNTFKQGRQSHRIDSH